MVKALYFFDNQLMGIKKVIGKRLILKRNEIGLSQEELAARVGIASSSLSAIERGLVYPRLNNLYKICKVLDLKLTDLFKNY